jgi:ribonuclease BN (tRNA processing enzyme)
VSFSLVTVGTGTVAPSATRASAAHWVEAGTTRLLMDCGAGTVHRLARFGLRWETVTHLALTHFHADHVGEVPALLFALRHATVPRRVDPLVVLGPPGTVALMENMARAFGAWVTAPGFPVVILEIVPDEPFPLEADVWLECCPVPHTAESVAYGVRTGGARLVYTGDTGPSPALEEFAHHCDLLLAECSLPEPTPEGIHLTPRLAGELAHRAGAKRLVLTHFYPPVEQVDIAAEAAQAYRGPIALANDGGRFEIG